MCAILAKPPPLRKSYLHPCSEVSSSCSRTDHRPSSDMQQFHTQLTEQSSNPGSIAFQTILIPILQDAKENTTGSVVFKQLY